MFVIGFGKKCLEPRWPVIKWRKGVLFWFLVGRLIAVMGAEREKVRCYAKTPHFLPPQVAPVRGGIGGYVFMRYPYESTPVLFLFFASCISHLNWHFSSRFSLHPFYHASTFKMAPATAAQRVSSVLAHLNPPSESGKNKLLRKNPDDIVRCK
jgi:hypothetical protein